jgi:hypothetical protein
MLEGVQAEVGEITGLRVAEDPENAALFSEFVEHQRSLTAHSRSQLIVYDVMQ